MLQKNKRRAILGMRKNEIKTDKQGALALLGRLCGEMFRNNDILIYFF